ncbi:MAG TPA: hypothetical protein VLE43_17590, partial [Candidatus Saccharimonadia bacterium]|nr:hypothetical protein [Candidatus Saccharimonadia bacterium]
CDRPGNGFEANLVRRAKDSGEHGVHERGVLEMVLGNGLANLAGSIGQHHIMTPCHDDCSALLEQR